MHIHPVSRLVCLVLASVFITQGGWLTVLIILILLLPFYLRLVELWPTAFTMLKRLKWFFLSIFVVFYYYTPELQSAQSDIMSYRAMPGLFRIMVLVSILLCVNLFIKTTSKEQILSALLWLFSPLSILTINVERVSLRAVLTLEYIEKLSSRLADYKRLKVHEKTSHCARMSLCYIRQKQRSFFHLVEHSAIILHEILHEADTTSGQSYTIDCLAAPTIGQLFFPIVVCIPLVLSL